jgi:hypothetical protein
MKKIIGWLIFLLPFLILFLGMAINSGILAALYVFLLGAVILGLIALGLHLILGKD